MQESAGASGWLVWLPHPRITPHGGLRITPLELELELELVFWEKQRQYYVFWCPGSFCCQSISSYDTTYIYIIVHTLVFRLVDSNNLLRLQAISMG